MTLPSHMPPLLWQVPALPAEGESTLGEQLETVQELHAHPGQLLVATLVRMRVLPVPQLGRSPDGAGLCCSHGVELVLLAARRSFT